MQDIRTADIKTQAEFVLDVVGSDERIMGILRLPLSNRLGVYIGAGSVNQRVWNKLTGRDLEYGIDDFDVVYYSEDVNKESEIEIQEQYDKAFPELNIECVNQARVHIWYEEDFGRKIDPILSVEDGINFWTTTATAVAVYLAQGELKLYAPRGLEDLLSMRLRVNKGRITKGTYEHKVKKWKAKWPELEVVNWGD